MARLKPKEFDPTMLLKIQKLQTDNIIKANRQDDAKNFLDTWRMNNLGTKDSNVLPPVDAVPPHLRGIIFKRAETTPRDGMKIASLADGRPDPSMMNYVTEKGFFLDGRGNAYQQRGNKFGAPTEYNPDIHGLPVPLAKGKDSSPFTTPRLQNQLKIKQFQNNADKVFKRDKPEKV